MSLKQTSPLLQSIFFCVFALFIFSSEIYAQCTVGNTVGSNDPENDFFWAQSFTAECTGTLEYIEFITGNDGGTQPATTLKIFEGESVTEEPIYTQATQEMTFNGAGERLRVILNEGLPVTQGQKYTFEMQVFVNLQISTSNPYTGGIAFENGTAFEPVDFVFNIQMALAFVRQRPFVTSTIIGATSIDQLSENIKSVEVTLSEEILSEIQQVHDQQPNPAP